MKRRFYLDIELNYEANDESEATAKATELSHILVEAGYEHVATTVMADDGERVAEFGL